MRPPDQLMEIKALSVQLLNNEFDKAIEKKAVEVHL